MAFRVWITVTLVGLAVFLGLLEAASEIHQQAYIGQTYYRNALLVAVETVNHRGRQVLLLALAGFLFEALLRALSPRRASPPWAFGFGLAAGLALVLAVGWHQNRHVFRGLWRLRREVFGFPVPQALLNGKAVAVNLGIVSAGISLALLLCLALRIAVARLGTRRSRGIVVRLRVISLAGWLVLIGGNGAVRLADHLRKPPGPSVVLISLDTLRADFLGAYGYQRPTSPSIDALSADCVVFENAMSQAPSTLPSHASFLTSRYPSVNRASTEGQRLPKWRILASEVFREAGYRTAGVVDAVFLTNVYGLEQGYDDYETDRHRAKKIVPWALRWLRGHRKSPFFLFLHIYDIHSPYARFPEYQRMFLTSGYRSPIPVSALPRYTLGKDRERDPELDVTAEDTGYFRSIYAGGIRYADDLLAPLFEYLGRDDVKQNTVVVLTADHGEEFFEHRTFLHGTLYRTVTHVPLLIRLPGAEAAGTRIDRPVGLIDLLPTLIEITGVASPPGLSGHSLLDLMRGRAPARPYVFSEQKGGRVVSVSDDRHHLLLDLQKNLLELFDYRKDPEEQKNLMGEKPGLADSLLGPITEWRRVLEAEIREESDLPGKRVALDEQTRKELRALGYIR